MLKKIGLVLLAEPGGECYKTVLTRGLTVSIMFLEWYMLFLVFAHASNWMRRETESLSATTCSCSPNASE
jgi:hypothetical protein